MTTTHSNAAAPMAVARTAGILILIMAAAAIFSFMYVPSALIVSGDAAATVANITESEPLFRLGLVGHVVILFADLAVSILLYVLFAPVSRTLALLAAGFRLVMTAMRAIALTGLVMIPNILGEAQHLQAFAAEQRNAFVMLALDAFDAAFRLDLTFFGPHLVLLGYLVLRSGFVPRALGALLVVAGASYLIDSVAAFLWPAVGVETAAYFGWAELLFAGWLAVRGIRAEQWRVYRPRDLSPAGI